MTAVATTRVAATKGMVVDANVTSKRAARAGRRTFFYHNNS